MPAEIPLATPGVFSFSCVSIQYHRLSVSVALLDRSSWHFQLAVHFQVRNHEPLTSAAPHHPPELGDPIRGGAKHFREGSDGGLKESCGRNDRPLATHAKIGAPIEVVCEWNGP